MGAAPLHGAVALVLLILAPTSSLAGPAPIAAAAHGPGSSPQQMMLEPPSSGDGEEDSRDLFGRRIAVVSVRLPAGVEADGLTTLIPLRVGTPLESRDLRQAVRILFETRRFRQVRAHVREEGEGVSVTFVLLPRQRVAEISFLGAEAVDASRLERVAGITRGDEISPQALERLSANVRRVYARLGHRDARVGTELRESGDGQVAVLVRIAEGPVTRFSEVLWEGEAGLSSDHLAAVLGLSVGDAVGIGSIEDALDRVRSQLRDAGFLQAVVGSPRIEVIDGGVCAPAPSVQRARTIAHDVFLLGEPARVEPEPCARIVVPIAAGPIVRVRIVGNEFFPPGEVRGLMRLDLAMPVDFDSFQDGVRRLERAYRHRGFHHARVRVTESQLDSNTREIRVEIDEGPPMRVLSLSFPGASAFSEAWMQRQICAVMESEVPRSARRLKPEEARLLVGRAAYSRKSKQGGLTVPHPEPCEIFDLSAYQRGIDLIIERYRREGWLSARVEAPRLDISPDRRRANVTILVVEGVETRLVSVAVEGNEALEESALLSAAGLQLGRPHSTRNVEQARQAVRRLYASAGHPFVAVESETTFQDEGREASLVFRVVEGPRVLVGRIIVRGHHHTPASLVRAQLTFGSGDPWVVERVQSSQRRILSLGIYKAASVSLLQPDEPAPMMDVVVTVTERRPKAVEMGLGISTEDGPRVFAEYVDNAFFMSSELRTRAKVNYPIFPSGLELRRVLTPGMEWEAQAGLRLPTLLFARTDIVGERANRPTFGLTRAAWSVGSDTRWSDDLTASLGVEMEYVDFERAAPDPDLFHTDRERRRFEEGRTLLASLRPGVVLDLRDRRVSPTSGMLASASVDWTHDLGLGIPVHFLKGTAALFGYLSPLGKVTLALSAQGGVVVPLSEDNVTIEPKRFFLGGADNLRGFPLDGVVPMDQRAALHQEVDECRRLVTPLSCTEDALLMIYDVRRPASAGGEAFVLLKGELRFPIVGGLQGGIFLDAGNLWREVSLVDVSRLRTSAGGGLRYETPVGPVAIDLGVNLARDEVLHELPMALHFAIGLF